MTSKRLLLGLAALVACAACSGVEPTAAPRALRSFDLSPSDLTVDQANTSGFVFGMGINASGGIAQGFTPTADNIVAVDLFLTGNGSNPAIPLGVAIRSGTFDGPTLGTATLNVPAGISGSPGSPTVLQVQFAAPISLIPGNQYYIHVDPDGGFLGAAAAFGNSYPGGDAYQGDFTLAGLDIGFRTYSGTIKPKDTTPPVTTAAASPAPNGAGWNNTSVSVTLSASDDATGGSGIAATYYGVDNAACASATPANCSTYTTPFSVSTEGTHTVKYFSVDGAGNVEAAHTLTIKVDETKPVVIWSGNAGAYTVDQTVSLTCSASDALSGLASSTCANVNGPAYTFAIGTNTYSASATDVAGNTNTASTSFTVSVTNASLCNLTTAWVSGSGVANSLCVKLNHGDYGAFRNELSAQSGKKISADNAAILMGLVNTLAP